MLFKKGELSVRKLQLKDNQWLAKWLSDPRVLEFYEGRDNPFDIEKVNKKFYDRENDVTGCMIEHKGVEVGYIQFYPLAESERKMNGYDTKEIIYGIDQFIGEPEFWNRGIGTLLVTSMTNYLIKQKLADRIVMDPQIRNTRALKCYEKCGFKKVKMLPKHELHEGEYQDCWWMEYQPH